MAQAYLRKSMLVIVRSEEDLMMLVGTLKYHRERKGITQAGAARLMGCHVRQVIDIEKRGTNSLRLLLRYVEALGAEMQVELWGQQGGSPLPPG
jgi:transcriptional regulator with XRE-family HTH domain